MAVTQTLRVIEKKSKTSRKLDVEKLPAVVNGVAPLPEPNYEEPKKQSIASSGDESEEVSFIVNEKKRKRAIGPVEDELEIDVLQPEPLSKKAARKAKKSKVSTGTETPVAADGDDSTVPQIQRTSVAEVNSKNQVEKRTSWGIWIGNLPWTASKQDLRDFLCSTGTLKAFQISRVHMPAPKPLPHARPGDVKPLNKGFAYVDFDSKDALDEVLKLSEMAFDSTHRKVLIKKSDCFDGRPDTKQDGSGKVEAAKGHGQKPPSKRVFVGNLSFDTTKEDLAIHYGQCGEVLDVHVATFEDSGKCKGFAWVTFDTEEASTNAVRGFIYKKTSKDDSEDDNGDEEEGSTNTVEVNDGNVAKQKPKKVSKPRKWYVNKLHARVLRVEYAEDAQSRYKKRFGKDGTATGNTSRHDDGDSQLKKPAGSDDLEGEDLQTSEKAGTSDGSRPKAKPASTPHERRKEARSAKRQFDSGKVDARTIKPGAALANAQRNSGAIIKKSESKITKFD